MATQFEVGKAYRHTDYGFTGRVTVWDCVKRSKVMATFVCRETGETCKAKIRSESMFGGQVMDYEVVYIPRNRSLVTLNEVA